MNGSIGSPSSPRSSAAFPGGGRRHAFLRALREVLAEHRGAARAIRQQDLAEEIRSRLSLRAGLDSVRRRVREGVAALCLEGLPVGSSTGVDPGYFIVATEAERELARGLLIRQARSIARRLHALDAAAARRLQLALFDPARGP